MRKHTDVPLVVGFGISTPEHVRQTSALADGVVVGERVDQPSRSLPLEEQPAAATEFVRALAAATGKNGGTAIAAGGEE